MARFRTRYLLPHVKKFLKQKMVFIGGPRQVGKTSLCLQFLEPKKISNPAYLNWDDLKSREHIKNREFPISKKVLCFDEVHKFKDWRSLMKGLYDKHRDQYKFLVTGSARLDHYRKGGDSLLGRYFYLRLHPFTLHELSLSSHKDLQALLKFGGFPEPFLKGSDSYLKMWRRERVYRVVYDDIRDLNRVQEIGQLELLADSLISRVGSPLSVKNLSNDLVAHHQTVENWLKILDSVYYSYRIAPFGTPKIKAVKKEQKLYLWDWSVVQTEAFRFENMVASHLLKYCHFTEDTKGDEMELRYLRDVHKREIDFVVLKNKKPLFAVECKSGERGLSKHIEYFKERTNISQFYQVHLGQKHVRKEKGVEIIPFLTFCKKYKL